MWSRANRPGRVALFVLVIFGTSILQVRSFSVLAQQKTGDVTQTASWPKETWTAASRTAESITGDVVLTARKIGMQHREFPLTLVHTVDKQHLDDAGKIVDQGMPLSASLYKTMIPRRSKLVHGNSMCGDADATWLLVLRYGEQLSLAFFSGQKEPSLEYEAVENSRSLCGTFHYVSPGK